MIGIVVSTADDASERIGEALLSAGDWDAETLPDPGFLCRAPGFALYRTEQRHLETVDVADAFEDPAFVVFVSRHAGETGPLLTAHFTGNFGSAEYGGESRELAAACPNALARVLDALDEHAPPEYGVAMECTHHGPSRVGAPSMFVEVGSEETQWHDPDAARAVARAVLSLRGVAAHRDRQLVVFGGGHYAPRATRLARETDWAVGHVGADWALEDLGDPGTGREVIAQAFERSQASRAVVEGDRPDLRAAVADLGYRVVGETWVREVEGVPLDLVETLEARLRPVAEGLRFGAPARDADPGVPFDVVSFPSELVGAAAAVDREATVGAALEAGLAVETVEGGNRLGKRGAFPSGGCDAFLDEVVDVLADAHDAVERRADAVVVREEAFDPELARRLGVPEGPAFGRLADGQAVEVDGETIPPDAVSREQTETYPL